MVSESSEIIIIVMLLVTIRQILVRIVTTIDGIGEKRSVIVNLVRNITNIDEIW